MLSSARGVRPHVVSAIFVAFLIVTTVHGRGYRQVAFRKGTKERTSPFLGVSSRRLLLLDQLKGLVDQAAKETASGGQDPQNPGSYRLWSLSNTNRGQKLSNINKYRHIPIFRRIDRWVG